MDDVEIYCATFESVILSEADEVVMKQRNYQFAKLKDSHVYVTCSLFVMLTNPITDEDIWNIAINAKPHNLYNQDQEKTHTHIHSHTYARAHKQNRKKCCKNNNKNKKLR